MGPPGTVLTFWRRDYYIIFGFPSGFVEALSRVGCFVLSFGRFLATFRWILWRMIDPEDEAATILRNDCVI